MTDFLVGLSSPKLGFCRFWPFFGDFSDFGQPQNCRDSCGFWDPEIWEVRGFGDFGPSDFRKSEFSVKNECSKAI